MWTNFNVAALVLGSLVVSQAASIETSKAQAAQMAQNSAASEKLPGRGVLVAGADTIVDGKAPATISIDIGKEAITARSKLELTLAPARTVPNEGYLIVVSLKTREGSLKRLGTTSFFPPRAGGNSIFYFDAAPIAAELKAARTSTAELSVALVPVERSKALTASAVRVVGARLVEG